MVGNQDRASNRKGVMVELVGFVPALDLPRLAAVTENRSHECSLKP